MTYGIAATIVIPLALLAIYGSVIQAALIGVVGFGTLLGGAAIVEKHK